MEENKEKGKKYVLRHLRSADGRGVPCFAVRIRKGSDGCDVPVRREFRRHERAIS